MPRAVGECLRKGELGGGPTPQRWGSDLIRGYVATPTTAGKVAGLPEPELVHISRQRKQPSGAQTSPGRWMGAHGEARSHC